MTISKRSWQRYIDALRKIDETAAAKMDWYIQEFGLPQSQEDLEAFLYAAWNISDTYGQAAATLAAEMYDYTAQLQGAQVPDAEPAPTATYQEAAKAVQGALKSGSAEIVSSTVRRLTRQAGADTVLQNALRDGAQFAWIPSGDSCAFCLTLSSRGWQYASKRSIKNGHAEHIHANCDCAYAVRFDGKSQVQGYDPEKYLEMYNNADPGGTPKDKINAMRREQYQADKDRINEQKRIAYRERKERHAAERMGQNVEAYGLTSVAKEYYDRAAPGKGSFSIPEQKTFKNREKENMALIYDTFGGNITAPIERSVPGKRNPDYIWKGKNWEEQEPTAHTNNAIDANVREAIHQIANNPGGIILDIGSSDMSLENVLRVTGARLKRSASFDCDIIVIRNGIIEEIVRYKK